jgi:hypothetical protein
VPKIACEFFKLPRVYRAPLLLKHVCARGNPDVRGQGVHVPNSIERLYGHTVFRRAATVGHVRLVAEVDGSRRSGMHRMVEKKPPSLAACSANGKALFVLHIVDVNTDFHPPATALGSL